MVHGKIMILCLTFSFHKALGICFVLRIPVGGYIYFATHKTSETANFGAWVSLVWVDPCYTVFNFRASLSAAAGHSSLSPFLSELVEQRAHSHPPTLPVRFLVFSIREELSRDFFRKTGMCLYNIFYIILGSCFSNIGKRLTSHSPLL